MASQAQINIVRLNIDDKDCDDFDDSEIEYFIDVENSINYATVELLRLLKIRLRKELLEADTTGTESSKFASVKERKLLLDDLMKEFEKKYEEESSNTTGRYIESVKPTIAGGDV